MNEKSVNENLANMTLKEKFDYLLYYYKVHIIVFILVMIAIGSFVYTESSKKSVYLNISYWSSHISDETSKTLQSDLEKSLLSGDDSQMICLDSYNLENDAELTKIQASIASHELDVAIMSKDDFDKYYPAELFLDLNSISGFSSLKIDSNLLIQKDNGIYGIKINNLNYLNQLNTLKNSDNILVVLSNTKNKDKILSLLNSCIIN
ncbi:MAG: hypothetical protein E7207_04960 [Clostridium butyricum]|nr:hypothetical protein [Clostridium butyricum]